jgi:hypothetical protein
MHAFCAGIVRADSPEFLPGRRPDLKTPGRGRTRRHRAEPGQLSRRKTQGELQPKAEPTLLAGSAGDRTIVMNETYFQGHAQCRRFCPARV